MKNILSNIKPIHVILFIFVSAMYFDMYLSDFKKNFKILLHYLKGAYEKHSKSIQEKQNF